MKNYVIAIILTLFCISFSIWSCHNDPIEPEVNSPAVQLVNQLEKENPKAYEYLVQFAESLIEIDGTFVDSDFDQEIQIRDQVKFDTAANELVIRGQSFLTDPKISLVQKSGNGWSLASKDNALILDMTQVQGRLPAQVYLTVNGQLTGVIPFFRLR